MKFGLMFVNTGFGSYGSGAVDLATAAEAAGFESLWTVEHVVVPSGYESAYPYDPSGKMAGGAEDFDLPDPLLWLAYVAAVTTTIRLATGILILPQRNPVITAKEVATLDHLSGGRVVLGVGVGWLEEEFRGSGCRSPSAGSASTPTSTPCARCGRRTRPRSRPTSPISRTASCGPGRRTGPCRS
jgi:alkanesulfonate monooxygenase SsuD/methylene tetrahydromethanopterin reductase-like flavin-dependent oxidoreductase (luciferase family)